MSRAEKQHPSIDLVVQALPPIHDAIGEYTACLASQLSQSADTRILTSYNDTTEAVTNVTVKHCFDIHGRRRFTGLMDRLLNTKADAVVLQYNPFAWGRRGWALDLANVFRCFKQTRPDVKFVVMFHETFAPKTELRFRIMRLWQVRQYAQLVGLSDLSLFSTGGWASAARVRWPKKRMVHLPVGSNLPDVQPDRSVIRQRYGIGKSTLVLGIFGGAHLSKQFEWVGAAMRRIVERTHDRPVQLLHVGGETARVRELMGDVPIRQLGRLDSIDAAEAISAMDLLLNPFLDGTSTRRGSTIAGLQSGIAVASTSGHNTEELWSEPIASGVTLTPCGNRSEWINAVSDLAMEPEKLRRDGVSNRRLFDEVFSWPVIANRLLRELQLEPQRDHVDRRSYALSRT